MEFEQDQGDTTVRHDALDAYVSQRLLTAERKFICPNHPACRDSAERRNLAFIEGEMPHFGPKFSLVDDEGRRLRIVIVGQERGRGVSGVGIGERTRVIRSKRDRSIRNPHIHGCVFAVLAALGMPADGSAGEYVTVDGEPTHVLDCFVLTNAMLCSALRNHAATGLPTTTGMPTTTMKRACASHLARTLEILEPTILILQGNVARASVASIIGVTPEVATPMTARIGATDCQVVALSHPTSYGLTNWANSGSKYLHDVVAPALHSARQRLRGVSANI